MINDDPSTLPSDADNYEVFCERCQKVHRHFTYTREDHERNIREAAQKLADEIDRRALAEIYATIHGGEK